MRVHNILATKPMVSLPDAIVAALHETGHFAALIQVRHWGLSAPMMELAIAPNGTRVIIEVSEDLHGDRDLDTSTHESVEAWVGEGERPSIRRVINVRYWDHADEKTITTLLDYLLFVTGGKLVA
jgi:hypothetical protein